MAPLSKSEYVPWSKLMVSLQILGDGHQTNDSIYITKILAIRRMTIADRMRLHHGTYPFQHPNGWAWWFMASGSSDYNMAICLKMRDFTPICGSFSMWNVMMNQYKPSNQQNFTSFFWGVNRDATKRHGIYIYTYNSLIRCMDNIRKTPILSGWVGSRKAFWENPLFFTFHVLYTG